VWSSSFPKGAPQPDRGVTAYVREGRRVAVVQVGVGEGGHHDVVVRGPAVLHRLGDCGVDTAAEILDRDFGLALDLLVAGIEAMVERG
jgi:hypothetical protein